MILTPLLPPDWRWPPRWLGARSVSALRMDGAYVIRDWPALPPAAYRMIIDGEAPPAGLRARLERRVGRR